MTTPTQEALPRESLGYWLETARKRQGISKSEAARRLGTTNQTYWGWLAGRVPNFDRDDTLHRLVEFTEMPRSVILASVGWLDWDDVDQVVDLAVLPIPGYLSRWVDNLVLFQPRAA